MGETTKIEWCDHTFNCWRGCSKVAPECANCYAETLSKRNPATLGVWGTNGTRVVAAESMWCEPLKWDRQAKADGVRRRVFCASLADVFEDWTGQVSHSSGVPMWRMHSPNGHAHQWGAGHVLDDPASGVPLTLDDVRRRLFALIDATPNLDWLLLTKRPQNIRRMWPDVACGNCIEVSCGPHKTGCLDVRYRQNVWLGTSAGCQATADKNIPELLKCRDLSPVLFVSCEPMLGPVDVRPWIKHAKCVVCECPLSFDDGSHAVCTNLQCESGNAFTANVSYRGPWIDGVICGGESGHGARPMHPDWPRDLRDQCQAAGVPFFFKQWGEWIPSEAEDQPVYRGEHQYLGGNAHAYKIGKSAAGRLLDGREWNEFPNVK